MKFNEIMGLFGFNIQSTFFFFDFFVNQLRNVFLECPIFVLRLLCENAQF